jgi:hypothetical protein
MKVRLALLMVTINRQERMTIMKDNYAYYNYIVGLAYRAIDKPETYVPFYTQLQKLRFSAGLH